MPCSRPKVATAAISRSTAGLRDRVQMRHRRIVARRGHHILREVVGTDREEGDPCKGLRRDRHRGNLDHDAERRQFVRHASPREIARLLLKHRDGRSIFVDHRDHREHHLEIAMRRGAQQRPDLHAKDLRTGQRQADAAQAEERIALFDGEARHRLVAAGIDGADGDGLAGGPLQHLAVGGVLHHPRRAGPRPCRTGIRCASARRRRRWRYRSRRHPTGRRC